jgi:hypothetical protein
MIMKRGRPRVESPRVAAGVTLDSTTKLKGDYIAEVLGLPFSRLIEMLLRAEIKRFETEHGEIKIDAD